MSFFKDLKEDIAQSVNELTESLDENLAVDDEKTKETVSMSELTTDFPPEEPTEEVPDRKSTRLNSSHDRQSRMPSSA